MDLVISVFAVTMDNVFPVEFIIPLKRFVRSKAISKEG